MPSTSNIQKTMKNMNISYEALQFLSKTALTLSPVRATIVLRVVSVKRLKNRSGSGGDHS